VAPARPPGLTPPGGSPYHAVPPLPQLYSSPMPTLPPPSRNAPVEPTIGFGVTTTGFSARIGADGSIHFDDEGTGFWAGADPILGLAALIQFDTTDGAMRAAYQDPYAAEKLRFMDDTREERMAMRRVFDQVVMQRALDDLPRYLDAVWGQRRWSPSERRRILFALWDEAAEDDDYELVADGGAEARRLIERFIAFRLPPGSRHAFGMTELAQLNRIRQSRQSFAPYPSRAASRVWPARLPALASAPASAPTPATRAMLAALRTL